MKLRYALISGVYFAAMPVAANTTLWTIGKPDNSSSEFAVSGKHAEYPKHFGSQVRFTVGQDDTTSWPAIHPGPRDAWAASTSHPLIIAFEIGVLPETQCQLVIETLAEHKDPGRLQVQINGHDSTLQLPGGCGDPALEDDSKSCPQKRIIAFHPSLLKQGRNEISLTITNGGWLIYDAVHLDVTDAPLQRLVNSPEILPSVCLVKHDSKLAQVVRLKAVNAGLPVDAVASTQAGGEKIDTPVSVRFGENVFNLPVARVQKPTSVTVTLKTDDSSVTASGTLQPQREWTIYAAPSIHTDIGYTHMQADVLKRHNENLDKVLEMCARNPLFKWNIEVAWELKNYFEDRPTTANESLISLMKQGRVGLQAGYLNMLTALMSDEAMNRYIQYAGQMHNTYGIDISSAIQTDVPTATWSIPSTLAASGVKYFAGGCNQTRGPLLKHSGMKEPFYWEGPDGARVLALICEGYAQSGWLAHTDNIDQMQEHVANAIRTYDHAKYPYDAIYLYGAFLDNEIIGQRYGNLLKEWGEKWASPKIIISAGPDYFQYIEKEFADKIPVKRGDFGGFWEDGAGSTMQETIQHMGSQHRAAAAESVWAMARLAGKQQIPYPVKRFEKVWDDILFYAEHTWGAAQSISDPDSEMTRGQWAVKAEYAHRPDKETRELLKEGVNSYITTSASGQEMVVVNTLSWKRSGLLEVPASVPAGFEILDEDGKAVTIQAAGGKTVFLATDIPGFGNRLYRIGKKSASAAPPSSHYPDLENKYYSIRFKEDLGVVSITDKETLSELIDVKSEWGFGQLVYAAGGEQSSLMEDHISTVPTVVRNDNLPDGLTTSPGKILLTGSHVTRIEAGERGPLFDETVLYSKAPSMPLIKTAIRLHHNEKRISYDIQITSKTEVRAKEGVYVAFPVAAKDPKFRLGMTNAVARPEKDFLHGGCHEWYCVQDFVSCSEGAKGPEVVWSSPDAPLVTLGQVNSGRWQSDFDTTTPVIFSYVMNNYWMTNYKAGQGGDFRLRYEITSSDKPASNVDCVRFARESAMPLLAATGNAKAAKGVTVAGDAIVASAIVDPEDKKTVLVRLRNCEFTPATATVSGDLRGASEVNLIGQHRADMQLGGGGTQVQLKPQETKTLRVIPRQRLEGEDGLQI